MNLHASPDAPIALRLAGGPRSGEFTTVYACAVLAALAAACDLRMIRRGGLAGPPRIARHVWRMSAALFVATGSFFLGQQKFLPEAICDGVVPMLPVLAVLALLAFWMVRVRFARAFRPQTAAAALGVVLATGLALGGGSADAGPYRAPRTAFGAPDLQGLWTNSSLTFLQRPPIFKALIATDAEAAMMESMFNRMVGDLVSTKPIDPNNPAPPVVKAAPQADFLEMDLHLARIDGQRRSSWIVDPANGQIPFTEAGRKAVKDADEESFDGPEGRPVSERCLTAIGSPEGPPMMNTGFNANYQIVQTRDHVAISIEMNHDVRIVRMGDRTHIPAGVSVWMGDSVGWWEGDTLVVETTNFDPRGFVGSLGGGFAWSAKGKLTERFTRIAKDRILYAFQAEDPVNFKQPWRGEMPMRTATGPIYEYACHEGNYSLPNALSGARVTERAAAATPPAGH
ncbi:hypothetical protein [Phenylobacterium sp.]|uniref:hypothetical protein n=1 Tax=Phenylobacterium sp. TaxID=1871053 RepID=UPI0025D69C20|nr:hypothetical protein [Phenylobacterium sp.]